VVLGVLQYGLEIGDFVDHVVTILAIASFIEALGIGRDIHVMPRCGFLTLAANFIGPACDLGFRDIGVTQQCVNPRFGGGRQTVFGDQTDNLVAVTAPGMNQGWQQQQG